MARDLYAVVEKSGKVPSGCRTGGRDQSSATAAMPNYQTEPIPKMNTAAASSATP